MTPIQIGYFKHFMFDKGLERLYISMYKKNRIKGGPKGDKDGNPESIEEFLQNVDVENVLMKAFYFFTDSQYGCDYWAGINDKWLDYWDDNKDNFINDKYISLRGPFGILRQNWDLREYFKKQSREETYARMHMEPPIDAGLAVSDKGKEILDDDKKIESEFIKDPEEVEKIISEPTHSNPEPGSLLEGFSLVETINPHGGNRISTNAVSVNMRNGGYRMTFSTKVSEKLRKHCYEYVKLLTKQETKEIALIFNHMNGCKVTIKKNTTNDSRNVTINSKDIVEHIHRFYSLKKVDDYFSLEITATIQQDNNTIFKLKYKE